LSGYRTRGKVRGDAVGLYAGWVQDSDSRRGAYVDAWAQYARFDNEVQGDSLTKETYDARSRSASLEAGYAWRLHASDEGELYLQPQVQLVYTDITSDRVQEANGTLVEDDTAGGLQSRVGLRLFGNRIGAGNRVQPFLAINWLHSARAEVLRFNAERLDADLPDSRYEAQAGAQLQLGQRWLAWGDLRVQRGNNGYRDAAAQIGLRAAW
ncbi:MAG TPA: autotransporter outer membrane beta-barrel domain-containing protein, partial [Stenotrophomonas sp.]|nr:autotransporter outer membrane beta-barrel domain-containing protein [Stenotrophomonas sp.]